MKKLFKKSIACLIAVLMVFSTMPLSAFAAAAMDVTENVVNGNNYSLLARYGTVDYFCEVLNVYADGNWVASKGNKIVVPEGTKKIEFKFSAGTYQDQTYDATYIANLTNGACYYGSSGDNYSISTDKAWKMTVDGTSASVSGFGESALTGSDKALYKNGNGRSFDTTFTYTNDSGMTAGTKNAVWQYKVQLFNRTGWTLWKYTGVKAETNAELLSVNFEIEVQHNYQTDSSSAQAATCTTAGKHADLVCSVCGDRITGATIPATGHNLTQTVAKDATCTEAGNSAYWTCSTCQKMFSDADATMEITEIPTISATGHHLTETVAKDATCTEAGNSAYWTCSTCQKMFSDANAATEITKIPTIPATGHHLTETVAKDATCTEAGNSAYWTCSDCGKMFSDAEATIEITEIPTIPALGHDYDVEYNAETNVDVFTCKNCKDTYSKAVAKMEELNAAIDELEALVNADDAAYKYEASALIAAKEAVANAKAYVKDNNNRYEIQQLVDAETDKVLSAVTKLTVDGLAKYSQTFIIRKDDGKGNTTDLKTFTQGYENLAYGSTVEFNEYTIPTIEDESSTLNGLPMYAVYKWVKIVNGAEQKLGTTDVQISDVVKGKTTYICYVLDFKATDDTQTKTRVRYLDKSGNTIEFDTATVGEPYTRKDTSIAPIIPYYNCTGWDLVFGNETTVGTRELVYRAIYTFNETEANRCTIVGLPGVYVNGTTGTPGYKAYYDEKIELTGADKYAYADEYGNIIAPINENYIFAPHLNGVDKTIYITKVETPIEDAKSIITGVFTIHPDDSTYNYLVINAQYYLPEGAKAVEAGAVIGNKNDANVLKIGSALKVVSDTQGDNHEYSLQMSYSKNKTGTLYARSYLIYVDSNGDTQTVYSDDITTCNLD